MKNLDLNACGVSEMNIVELQIAGGALPLYQEFYQDGAIKSIWYEPSRGSYVTNSSTWLYCA